VKHTPLFHHSFRFESLALKVVFLPSLLRITACVRRRSSRRAGSLRNACFGLWALISLAACHTEAHKAAEVVRLEVTQPLRKDTLTTRQYVCQIHSVQHIELRALEKGYLEKIYVDEGQFIKKGQLMFQIMPRLYQAELQRAEAEVNFAQIEYENTQRLAEKNIVAPNELALAKAKLDKAKAELALAQVHLDFTQIRAPFDGIMDHFHVREGSLLEEGELLTTLSDNHEMWVYFNVPEAEYLDYRSEIKKDSMLTARLLMANNRFFEHESMLGNYILLSANFQKNHFYIGYHEK
jgi:membrane fusion protein (multidrug efflux system)